MVQVDIYSRFEVYIDTGIFEGIIDKSDEHHEDALRGIERIRELGGLCIVILPIIFETRKRFLHLEPRPRPDYAKQFMEMIRENSFYIIEIPIDDEIEHAQRATDYLNLDSKSKPLSDEDALLAYCASMKSRPVFTFDDRHFNILEQFHDKKKLRWWGWQS